MVTLHNPRRERYAQIMALGGRQVDACRELGITADMAWKWAKVPRIVERINQIKAAAARHAVMDLTEMEERLTRMGRADLGDFFKQDGTGNIRIELEGKDTIALSGIDITNRAESQSLKIKVKDPIDSMELLAELQKFKEIPPNYNDNRQYNILVADEQTREEVRLIMNRRARVGQIVDVKTEGEG